jgi:hypothetical protein
MKLKLRLEWRAAGSYWREGEVRFRRQRGVLKPYALSVRAWGTLAWAFEAACVVAVRFPNPVPDTRGGSVGATPDTRSRASRRRSAGSRGQCSECTHWDSD